MLPSYISLWYLIHSTLLSFIFLFSLSFILVILEIYVLFVCYAVLITKQFGFILVFIRSYPISNILWVKLLLSSITIMLLVIPHFTLEGKGNSEMVKVRKKTGKGSGKVSQWVRIKILHLLKKLLHFTNLTHLASSP